MTNNPIGQKVLSLLLSLTLILSIFGVDTTGAFAAQCGNASQSPVTLYLDSNDGGSITIDATGYTVVGNDHVSYSGDYRITQHDSAETSNAVTVSGGAPDIEIDNININCASNGGCAFTIGSGASVHLTLAGENTLRSSPGDPGLKVPNGAALTVTAQSTGSLTASSMLWGAGIGGGENETGGTVTINGGAVAANGGDNAAGIGGSENGTGGTVIINGGIVAANGGRNAAGIGGGENETGGTVTINGGKVMAYGGNGTGGAGIGGGAGGSGGIVTISHGIVAANGADGGAGIGGGSGGSGGTVSVSNTDTQVNAKGQGGYDIGSGSGGGSGGTLAVSDGATVVMPNAAGTDANKSYQDCRIITGSNESNYDGNHSGTSVPLLTSALTAVPTASGFTLTASVKDPSGSSVTSGTFSFAYTDAKDSGAVQDVSVDPATGTATAAWQSAPDGPIFFTAKYTDSNGAHSATEATFLYNPDPINVFGLYCGGFGYTYDSYLPSPVITVNQNGWYSFQNGGTNHQIRVSNGVLACVTLNSVCIDASDIGGCAFSVEPGARVILTLEGTSTLQSGGSHAGIEVPVGASLTIEEQAANGGTLTAYGGSGSSTGGAGIGSAGVVNTGDPGGGNVTINGGQVEAYGGTGTVAGGAGFGSGGNQNGSGNSAGAVVINGGWVTVTGGTGTRGGAGIGGGGGSSGGNVSIFGSGTSVTATGANGGRDIGSGSGGSSGGFLTVGTGSSAVLIPPSLNLTSGGINAINPQFLNCTVSGSGATGANGSDLAGAYDTNGKIILDVSMPRPSSAKIGEPVTLEASVAKKGASGIITFPGKIQFTMNGAPLGAPVSIAADGTAQTVWTPTSGAAILFGATYVPASNADRFARTDSSSTWPYTPDKLLPTVTSNPTASSVTAGSPLSASKLPGGSAAVNGTAISGKFQWADPTVIVTASGDYPALFIPDDTTDYNTVPVTVLVTVTGSSGSSHETCPSLPSSVTEPSTGAQIDLSGATFPAWVTGVSLSVAPEAANGAPSTPGNAGLPADPQGAAVYHLVISQTGLNLIGSPFVYNIKLLDQNGNPITSFSGTVTVKVAIPAGIHGTPHIFRYEDSTGTFTDLGATVANGFLVFTTTHFSYYVVAGTGDSVTLDTKNYQMPVGAKYQIGVRLTGNKAASVKVTSTNGKVAAAEKLKNGNILVTGKGPGTAYAMIDVYDKKNHLLTHVSVRMDVKTGIRPRGDSTRQIGVF